MLSFRLRASSSKEKEVKVALVAQIPKVQTQESQTLNNLVPHFVSSSSSSRLKFLNSFVKSATSIYRLLTGKSQDQTIPSPQKGRGEILVTNFKPPCQFDKLTTGLFIVFEQSLFYYFFKGWGLYVEHFELAVMINLHKQSMNIYEERT